MNPVSIKKLIIIISVIAVLILGVRQIFKSHNQGYEAPARIEDLRGQRLF